MILVDTSIWIDALGPRPGAATKRLRAYVDRAIDCALCDLILVEVLQGARTDREFDRLLAYLQPQPFLAPVEGQATYTRAAELYRRCRAEGFTPRSTIDCVIAQLAIDHGVPLLHADREFLRIAAIDKRFRQVAV